MVRESLPQISVDPDHPTLLYVHVRCDLVEAGAPLDRLIEDVNQLLYKRSAIILADGQFLLRPISPDWDIAQYFDDETSTPYEHPPRPWSPARRQYFDALWGIRNPFQYAEDPLAYDQFCMAVLVPGGYLVQGERILAIAHAERDGRHLYCPSTCHHAEIVYTSRHRLVCMRCGRLHCVLAQPLPRHFPVRLTAEQWWDMFDSSGELADDSPPLDLVDYREIAAVQPIWQTDAWLQATQDLDLYANGSPEEIGRYERDLVGAEAFLEAGWVQSRQVPPPAAQANEAGFGVTLTENAARAVDLGASAYSRSQTDPSELREAVLNLSQAVELVLKIRLKEADPRALRDNPNNPTVVGRLQRANVKLDRHELDAIAELRHIRNQLQHAEATFSYRRTRTLLRTVITFLDRFTINEVNSWIGDAINPEVWPQLLALPAIQHNAELLAAARVAQVRANSDYAVTDCPQCGRQTLVRARAGGAECLYCRHRPTLSGPAQSDKEDL